MSRTGKLQVAGLVVAVLSTVGLAAVAILNPEARCLVRLDTCAESDRPTRAVPTFVDVAPEPDEPFFITGPQLPSASTATRIRLAERTIVNRGRPVPVLLRGEGFQPEGIADIEWYGPNGGTYLGTATHAGRDGRFAFALYWWPLQDAGIAGSNGDWRLTVTDRASGRASSEVLRVTSDADTPPPEQWPIRFNWRPPPAGEPAVSVGVRGDLCSGDGARVEVTVTGFPPDANIGIHHLRTDGQRIGFRSWHADGNGRAENMVDYFWTNGCDQARQFSYRVVVTADDWYVEADVLLPTARE